MVMAPAEESELLRRRVTDELIGFLRAERQAAESELHTLLDELEAVITAGGKRLRPRFCYWGFRAAGGVDGPEIIRAGAALELLHTFALIYDDLMDASPLRRSRRSSYRGMSDGRDRRFGTSSALLTGLLGFVLADRLLWRSGFAAERLAAVIDRFDRMRTHAIAGQYLDIVAAQSGDATEETVRRIGALKSAAYSVVDPLAIGALAADASPALLRDLEAYGRPIGEAFQIADDILGVFGDPEQTGKDADGDLREGKQTVLLTRTRALAAPADGRVVEASVGNADLDAQGAQAVRDVMLRCGALDETRALVVALKDEALAALAAADIGVDATAALRDIALEATIRDA